MASVSFDRCGQAKGHIDQMGATLDGVRTSDVPPLTTPDVPPLETPDVPPLTTPDVPPLNVECRMSNAIFPPNFEVAFTPAE